MRAGLPEPPRPGDGIAATVRCAAPSLSASSTALVISSTNSGMPSVRSMMSCRMLAGSSLLPTTRSIMALDVALRQPIEGESGHVRPSDPGRLEFRPERHDQQHAKARESGPRPGRTASRLVGSVQCASSKIISTGFWRDSASICESSASSVLLPALLRRQFERRITSVVRQRQHLGKQCRVLRRGRGLREQRIELVELRLRACRRAQVRRRAPSGR